MSRCKEFGASKRKLLREIYGDICYICEYPMVFDGYSSNGHLPMETATRDHVIPVILAGSESKEDVADITNQRLAHALCNGIKSWYNVGYARERLATTHLSQFKHLLDKLRNRGLLYNKLDSKKKKMTKAEQLRDIIACHPEFPRGVLIDLENAAKELDKLTEKLAKKYER